MSNMSNLFNKIKVKLIASVMAMLLINSGIVFSVPNSHIVVSAQSSYYVKNMKYSLNNWNCRLVAANLKKGIYTGYIKNKIPDGKGIFYTNVKEDGAVYKWSYSGLWKNGRPNGYGVMYMGDGFKYSGQWINGEMDGKCEMVPGGGDGITLKIVGTYKINKFVGNATYYLANGDKVVGCEKNSYTIIGTYLYKNGNKFIGSVDNEGYLLQGHGTFIYKNGRKVTGTWRDGKYETN